MAACRRTLGFPGARGPLAPDYTVNAVTSEPAAPPIRTDSRGFYLESTSRLWPSLPGASPPQPWHLQRPDPVAQNLLMLPAPLQMPPPVTPASASPLPRGIPSASSLGQRSPPGWEVGHLSPRRSPPSSLHSAKTHPSSPNATWVLETPRGRAHSASEDPRRCWAAREGQARLPGRG